MVNIIKLILKILKPTGVWGETLSALARRYFVAIGAIANCSPQKFLFLFAYKKKARGSDSHQYQSFTFQLITPGFRVKPGKTKNKGV